jgi:hypothetical protein
MFTRAKTHYDRVFQRKCISSVRLPVGFRDKHTKRTLREISELVYSSATPEHTRRSFSLPDIIKRNFLSPQSNDLQVQSGPRIRGFSYPRPEKENWKMKQTVHKFQTARQTGTSRNKVQSISTNFLVTGYVQVRDYESHCKMCNNNMLFHCSLLWWKCMIFIVLSSLETVQYRYSAVFF